MPPLLFVLHFTPFPLYKWLCAIAGQRLEQVNGPLATWALCLKATGAVCSSGQDTTTSVIILFSNLLLTIILGCVITYEKFNLQGNN